MTIYEIKQRTQETSPYYFRRDTLKFFGQTMRMFSVKKVGNKYKISAPSYWNGKLMGYSERMFNPETNELENIPND